MDFLLDKFSYYWNILETSTTGKVAKWDLSNLSNAIQWSKYIQETCNYLRSKPNLSKINQQLFARYTTNHLPNAEPSTIIIPSIENLCNAESLLVERLLGNGNATAEIFQFLLERYLPDDSPPNRAQTKGLIQAMSKKCVSNALFEVSCKIDAVLSEYSMECLSELSETSLMKTTIQVNAGILNRYIEYSIEPAASSREILVLKKKALFHVASKETGIAIIITALLQRYDNKSTSTTDPYIQFLTEFITEYYSDHSQLDNANDVPKGLLLLTLQDRYRELIILSAAELTKLASYCCPFFMTYVKILSFLVREQRDVSKARVQDEQQLVMNHFRHLLKGPEIVAKPIKQILTYLFRNQNDFILKFDDFDM